MHRDDEHAVAPAPVPGPPVRDGLPGASGAASAADPARGSGTSTGDDAVDSALALLDPLDALPVREHVRVFDEVHTALQARLADVGD